MLPVTMQAIDKNMNGKDAIVPLIRKGAFRLILSIISRSSSVKFIFLTTQAQNLPLGNFHYEVLPILFMAHFLSFLMPRLKFCPVERSGTMFDRFVSCFLLSNHRTYNFQVMLCLLLGFVQPHYCILGIEQCQNAYILDLGNL